MEYTVFSPRQQLESLRNNLGNAEREYFEVSTRLEADIATGHLVENEEDGWAERHEGVDKAAQLVTFYQDKIAALEPTIPADER